MENANAKTVIGLIKILAYANNAIKQLMIVWHAPNKENAPNVQLRKDNQIQLETSVIVNLTHMKIQIQKFVQIVISSEYVLSVLQLLHMHVKNVTLQFIENKNQLQMEPVSVKKVILKMVNINAYNVSFQVVKNVKLLKIVLNATETKISILHQKIMSVNAKLTIIQTMMVIIVSHAIMQWLDVLNAPVWKRVLNVTLMKISNSMELQIIVNVDKLISKRIRTANYVHQDMIIATNAIQLIV